MKRALVYDRINKFGGAEQVLLSLHDVFPDAPLYTGFYNKERAGWSDIFKIFPSFANRFPFASTHHELYPWLSPLAFESFTFDQYDTVISVTSAEAKFVITKPDTCHICYCLTPTRYLWSGAETYQSHPGLGIMSGFAGSMLSWNISRFRRWDKISAARPDFYIAISNLVKERIEMYYQREVSAVIHPPVNTDAFTIATGARPEFLPNEYFLVVSRLVSYKRLDLIIEAFNTLDLPLIIVGDGHERHHLQSIAGKNIVFVTEKLTEEKLAQYYQYCEAFIFAAEEDFGIVAGEAQACGKAVIAYKKSGIADIVTDETGILFESQTVEDIIESIKFFGKRTFDPSQCRSQALQFSRTAFQEKMKSFVEQAEKKYIL